jgi:hypothetical protein
MHRLPPDNGTGWQRGNRQQQDGRNAACHPPHCSAGTHWILTRRCAHLLPFLSDFANRKEFYGISTASVLRMLA